MAVALLNGTSAATTLTAGGTDFSGTLGYISMDFVSEMFEQTVFGQSGWRGRIRGLKQLIGRGDGYESTGAAYSDPLAYFGTSGGAVNTPTAFVYTATTSCTITFSGFVTRRHSGMRAGATSEAGYDIESFGPVATAWTSS